VEEGENFSTAEVYHVDKVCCCTRCYVTKHTVATSSKTQGVLLPRRVHPASFWWS